MVIRQLTKWLSFQNGISSTACSAFQKASCRNFTTMEACYTRCTSWAMRYVKTLLPFSQALWDIHLHLRVALQRPSSTAACRDECHENLCLWHRSLGTKQWSSCTLALKACCLRFWIPGLHSESGAARLRSYCDKLYTFIAEDSCLTTEV